MMNDKTIFAIFAISCVTFLQVVAWTMGFNGAIFAFTSLIIGAIAGSILGFSITKAGK